MLGTGAAVLALVGLGMATWLSVRHEPDVLLVGDSIMRQTGPPIEAQLSDHEVENRGVNGSGLLSPQVYDWVDRLPGLLAQAQPEATVVLFIGNYSEEADWWMGPDGTPVAPNTPAFFREWRAQAEVVVAMLEAAGTDIYWVLPPPVASEAGQLTITGLRAVYENLADEHPSVTLVDGAPPLTEGTGRFTWSVTDPQGRPVQLRAGDGVHLAAAGADRLAQEIAAAVSES